MMLLYKQDLQYFVRDDLINFQHSPVQEKKTNKCIQQRNANSPS